MLKQKFATQFGTNIIIKVITMFAGIVVARIAGPSVLGTISYAMSFVSIWMFITTMFSTAHMKLVSEGENEGNCITTFTYLKGLGIIIYILIVLGLLAFQVYSKGVQFKSSEQVVVIIISLLIISVTQIFNIVSNTLAAKLEIAKANVPIFLNKLIYNIARVTIVFLGAKAIGLSLCNLISLLIVFPLYFNYYNKFPKGKWDFKLVKKYVHYGIPTLLLLGIQSILSYSDKLILAHYTSVQELGYYAAAMSIGGSFLILSSSIGSIFFPLFSKLISENNWAMVNKKNAVYQRFNTLFILPFIGLIVIIAKPLILTMLGEKYLQSIEPFKIIVISTYFVIIGMPYGNIITGMGKFYTNVLINASQLILFIVSVTFFVSPNFLGLGAIGLALNLMIMYLYRNIVYIIVANRVGSLKYDWKNVFRSIFLLLLIIIFYFVSIRVESISLWWIYIIPIFYIIVYSSLYIFKMIDKSDLIILLEIINLKKTAAYIKSEI